jgi:hypothetical protein
MKKFVYTIWMLCVLPLAGFGYGPRGHALVGAIADRRLASNRTVAEKVAKLLDGMPLEQAATIPDVIKGWDDCKTLGGQFTVQASMRINAELRAFVKANPCNGDPTHHQFHYTDIPVVGNEKYGDGKIGRSDYDIVHMIAYCIRVLANKVPQPNQRAITRSVAVILLAHYLGDIHQPLHVGAQYFDDAGEPIEPTLANKGLSDQGGNKINLFLFIDGKVRALGNLHSYWDSKVVDAAFGDTTNADIASSLAQNEPIGWKLTGTPESLAEQMANDIMPVAREAHDRLTYSKVRFEQGSAVITLGRGLEILEPGRKPYKDWSELVVRNEIQKAGWRLAAILEAVLR